MKESLKTLMSSLGGLTATAAVELLPKIKKKKETGERTKDRRHKIPAAGLKPPGFEHDRVYKNGGSCE